MFKKLLAKIRKKQLQVKNDSSDQGQIGYANSLASSQVENQVQVKSAQQSKQTTKFKHKKPLMQKQIPTILGLLILAGSLVSVLVFFSQGIGVFAPRATPETTPRSVKVTNVTEKSFSVSFYTQETTPGFVKYGQDSTTLKSQASDDRDQLSGSVSKYRLHHITVRGLSPKTTYYYTLGTGTRANFDNNGQPFSVTTAADPNRPPPAAKTVYGTVSTPGNTPAEGSVVYLTMDGVGETSSLVKSSGSWAIPLSNARTADGSTYAEIKDGDQLNLFIQGTTLKQTLKHQVTVGEAQPVADLVFGQEPTQLVQDSQEVGDTAATATQDGSTETADPSPSAQLADSTAATAGAQQTANEAASISGRLTELLDQANQESGLSTASSTLDLTQTSTTATDSAQTVKVTTSKPKIKGKAAPNVEVKISVHSDNQIEGTATADENGEFEFDLEALKASLEPGDHEITYSYVDPDSGQTVEKAENFIVEDPVQLAQASTADTTSDTTEQPYGSGNPYSSSTPTGTPTPTVAPTASVSAGVTPTVAATKGSTRSAVVSTQSGVYQSGSVGTTWALVLGGVFFVLTGLWSWWLAAQIQELEK